MPTGERIQRVWLDDPSRVTLDFDAPLCSGRDSRSCSQSAASVIHLRRIKPLNWAGLPRANATLLTVITQGKTGRQLYQFRIAYGSGNPQYSTLEIRPNEIARTSTLNSRINLRQVERGLQVAITRGLVKENARIVSRINRFLTLSDNGTDMPIAARQAGISLDLVNKLASLGTR